MFSYLYYINYRGIIHLFSIFYTYTPAFAGVMIEVRINYYIDKKEGF